MRLIVINQGFVENFVAVTNETKAQTREFLEGQGFVVVESDAEAGIGWVYDEPTQRFYDIPNPALQNWNLSKRSFKNRFPRAKWVAASLASSTHPLLYDFFESFNLSGFINLKDEETIYIVTALSNESIPEEMRLTGQEVDNVLNLPAQQSESP